MLSELGVNATPTPTTDVVPLFLAAPRAAGGWGWEASRRQEKVCPRSPGRRRGRWKVPNRRVAAGAL